MFPESWKCLEKRGQKISSCLLHWNGHIPCPAGREYSVFYVAEICRRGGILSESWWETVFRMQFTNSRWCLLLWYPKYFLDTFLGHRDGVKEQCQPQQLTASPSWGFRWSASAPSCFLGHYGAAFKWFAGWLLPFKTINSSGCWSCCIVFPIISRGSSDPVQSRAEKLLWFCHAARRQSNHSFAWSFFRINVYSSPT